MGKPVQENIIPGLSNDIKCSSIQMIDVYIHYFQLGDDTILPFMKNLQRRVDMAIHLMEEESNQTFTQHIPTVHE